MAPTRSPRGGVVLSALLLLATVSAAADDAAPPKATKLPYPYVRGKAYYVLPETHNNQSGYFSLCEGLDGLVYVGTARYGENAFLVEFDPRTEAQRIVVDTNAVCGLVGRGYAAQAKLHTRNFVAPSGRVFVGSKQGYPEKGDTQAYPGGHVMAYDPRLGRAFDLGMPLRTEGVIDVVADEGRSLLYVVTCENQHWMRGDLKEDGPAGRGDGAPRAENYREIGPPLARYATTLLAADGCAYALTEDFQLARYDPAADGVTVRPIDLGGRRFTRPNAEAVPTWVLTRDRTRAYLILMNDPTLLEVPLGAGDGPVAATAHGRMLDGRGPDSRCALTLHPDGRVYALVREDNRTGFGEGYLHHLTRFDPASKKVEDLGVIAVENPDFFPLSRLAGKDPPPHCNGYHRLPDGTWTPLHHHMAMAAARDGTLYATFLAPFTLLRIEAFKLPEESPPSAAAAFLDAALAACDRAEAVLPEVTRAAEQIAERHLAGGLIGYPFDNSQVLAMETWGRAGGLVHVGFDRPFRKDRTAAEKANDVALVAYAEAPGAGDVDGLKRLRAAGCHLVGLGPRGRADLSGAVAACDAWIDTGTPGAPGGNAATLSNLVHGWCLTGEVVGALTRRGKMPTVWKSFAYDDGRAWADRYFGKKQFHDNYSVPPIPAGEAARAYLRQVRHGLRRLRTDEGDLVAAAARVADERRAGNKTVVAWSGHLGYGKPEVFARPWSRVVEIEPSLDFMVEAYRKAAPRGALVLRIGSNGRSAGEVELFRRMGQRVMYFSGHHPDASGRAPAPDALVDVELGFPFGDACVPVPGYPVRILPASGVLQLAAFGAIDAQVGAAGK